MISRSCQDSRLHTDSFHSSKGSRMSTYSRIATSGKSDSKKCAFECWLPDNCNQTAIRFRSVTGVSQAVSDMRPKRNRIRSCRFLMSSIRGDVGNWNANGANADNNRSTRFQSVKRVMRSAGCACPSMQTRFSVQPRSCTSRPLKLISCSASSSSFSSHSYCTVPGRDTRSYLTLENTKCENTKPTARFSSFRASSRRETGRLGPDVEVCCSTLPCNCSREATNCAEAQLNMHGKGRCCSSVDTVQVGSENTISANIQEAIAHIVTQSFQTGNDVDEEINVLKTAALLPVELHVLKAEHPHLMHSEAERCWNKLWNNVAPSGVEENESMVKLRQMAGKLIESLICKIKLQLESGIQHSTEEHECAANETEEHNYAVNEHQQQSHRTKEHAARSNCVTNDCNHQATDRHVAQEKSLKAEVQRNSSFNQIDVQPTITYRSANQPDNTEHDTQQGLHNPSEIQTTMGKSDRKSLSQKKSDCKMNPQRGSRPNKQENGRESDRRQHSVNGGDNSVPNIHQNSTDFDQNQSHGNQSEEMKGNKNEDKDKRDIEREIRSAKNDEIGEVGSSESDQSVIGNNAADADEEGGEDNEEKDEDEEEIETDKLLQNGSHQSTNEKGKSDMRMDGQQKGIGGEKSLRNSDYIEKTEAVKYRSVRPQPPSSPAASEPSASTSVRKEHEPQSKAENNSQKVKTSVGNDGVNKKDAAEATSSQSVLSNEVDLEETIEHALMDPEAEATLKSFASEVVQSLYTAIRYKLKHLVEDGKDEAQKLVIIQKGDTELKDQILPTIIEHIVWIIKEEFRGQDESEWKHAMLHDPGQCLDTIVTNAVMKTHADHLTQRAFLKTFVVTSNFKHSAKWTL